MRVPAAMRTPPTPSPDVTATRHEDDELAGDWRQSPELAMLGLLTPSWPATGPHGSGQSRAGGLAVMVAARTRHTTRKWVHAPWAAASSAS